MKPQNVIYGREHEISYDISSECRAWLAEQQTHHKKLKTLGLYDKRGGYAPGNFIGMVWIGEGDNKTVLRVDSKFPTMDYIKMFTDCVADQIISKKINCLHFWAEQDLINVDNDNDFLLLTAIAFLRELNTLCTRHLRRHFLREQQNFVGKVKGKILIGENLRQNIIRQRPDRIFCEYQSVSDDILENRILRTALEKAARCIAEHNKKDDKKNRKKGNKKYLELPQQWIRACRSHLNGVSISHIKQRDFAAVRTRGVFAHYKRPLHLAKAVLRQFGFNPQQDITQTQTPPFALNSEKLFERYAELKLREKFKDSVLETPGNIDYDENTADSFGIKVRPDFYIVGEKNSEQTPQIMDAKYKDIKKFDKGKPAREDIYQVVAYSQHQGLLNKMECDNNQKIILSLVYPSLDDDKLEEWKKTTAFSSELHVYKILCPKK